MADRQLDLSTSLTRTLSGETDAQVWAREFTAQVHISHSHSRDYELMLTWFANAIESGREAGRQAGYKEGLEAGKRGRITMDEARHLAATYDGGEGSHPLARHRDSMG